MRDVSFVPPYDAPAPGFYNIDPVEKKLVPLKHRSSLHRHEVRFNAVKNPCVWTNSDGSISNIFICVFVFRHNAVDGSHEVWVEIGIEAEGRPLYIFPSRKDFEKMNMTAGGRERLVRFFGQDAMFPPEIEKCNDPSSLG